MNCHDCIRNKPLKRLHMDPYSVLRNQQSRCGSGRNKEGSATTVLRVWLTILLLLPLRIIRTRTNGKKSLSPAKNSSAASWCMSLQKGSYGSVTTVFCLHGTRIVRSLCAGIFLAAKSICPGWRIWMHRRSSGFSITRMSVSAHHVAERSFLQVQIHLCSGQNRICSVDTLKLNRDPVKPYEGLFLMQSSWLSHIKQYIYQRIHATLWTEAVWLKTHIYRQSGRALFNQEKSKLMQTKGQLSESAMLLFRLHHLRFFP